MHNFKELVVWQKSTDLAIFIYQLTQKFPPIEKFGLCSQIRKSVISISSNIAEGAGRKSKRDFHNFIGIALGSGFELETQIISFKLNYITHDEFDKAIRELEEIERMLVGLQKSLVGNQNFSNTKH